MTSSQMTHMYVDLKHVDRGSKKYLAIFEAFVDDRPNLAFVLRSEVFQNMDKLTKPQIKS